MALLLVVVVVAVAGGGWLRRLFKEDKREVKEGEVGAEVQGRSAISTTLTSGS